MGIRLVLWLGLAAPLAAAPPVSICKPRAPSPPSQLTEGYGSSDYAHAGLIQSAIGEGAERIDLFEPSLPTPASAPVVVFFHGYGFTDPRNYGAWIRHLVLRGNIVLYPAYQDGYITLASELNSAAATSIRAALELLGTGRHIPPELDAVVFVGHSAGAVIAANLAGDVTTWGLPQPRAVMLANASDTSFGFGTIYNSIFDAQAYAAIPANTRLFAVIGDDDHIAPDAVSVSLLQAAVLVPEANKRLVRLHSDAHGCPRLIASHLAAGGVFEPAEERTGTLASRSREPRATALEFFGYWKWLDALLDAARSADTSAEVAAAAVLDETFMGHWSDGVPVWPAAVLWP